MSTLVAAWKRACKLCEKPQLNVRFPPIADTASDQLRAAFLVAEDSPIEATEEAPNASHNFRNLGLFAAERGRAPRIRRSGRDRRMLEETGDFKFCPFY